MSVPQTVLLSVFPLVFAAYIPMCTPKVTPTAGPSQAPTAALWERPDDLATRNLYVGPWGASHAPDPKATYTFVRPKNGGLNPGLVVRDPAWREWHVKQAPRAARTDRGDEGPAEVVLSRILSAIGYHQPPVYFLPALTLRDDTGTRTEPGGRFRLDVP